ncbi:hypothetical protein [Actinacidiphila yeochonensis]|uniref:hypothetical protein n=1 Tax=Actinacidiphila yeochonensis TaxID=89050 RepID=UPI0012FF55CD|nr:hypothetical protein [Actinacidiphila yeochonensis]
MTWIAGGVLGTTIPGAEEGEVGAQLILGTLSASIAGGTAWGSYRCMGGHADAVTDDAQSEQDFEMRALKIPIAQGVIDSGKARPPESPWFHDGKLDQSAIEGANAADFSAWWAVNAPDGSLTESLLNNGKDGYNDSTSMRRSHSQKDGK